MPDLPKNLSNSQARLMLIRERTRVTEERIEVARKVKTLQARLDWLDNRLREISDGERVLTERGN